jgi:oxygen-independent coproporphyrinogen-3 oxidase
VAGTGEYIARVRDGASAVAERWPRDRESRLEEALFMGLRLTDGVDLATMQARYGVDVWARYGGRLAPLARAGHLVHEPGRRIRLTRQGMLVANEAMSVFLDRENRVE